MNLDAARIPAPAVVAVGDDNKSHIFDMFGDTWCESSVNAFDEANDVDCKRCIEAFEEEE